MNKSGGSVKRTVPTSWAACEVDLLVKIKHEIDLDPALSCRKWDELFKRYNRGRQEGWVSHIDWFAEFPLTTDSHHASYEDRENYCCLQKQVRTPSLKQASYCSLSLSMLSDMKNGKRWSSAETPSFDQLLAVRQAGFSVIEIGEY